MKAKDLIEILQRNPELEVMASKGSYSQEIILAEETRMCHFEHSRWRRCSVKGCKAESQQAFFLT